MTPKISLLILFTAISFVCFSQKRELKTISESDLKAHLEFVASDFMQGRDFATEIPGLEITADYLRAQCMKMGLKPGLGDYFQTVEMVSVKPDYENTFFDLKKKNGTVAYKDKNIFAFSGSTENQNITGEIVFVGYGWTNEETGYNDFDGIEMKDKVVVVMTRNREIALDTSNHEENTNLEMAKMKKVFSSGAKAMIMVPDPLNPDKSWFEMVKSYVSKGTFSLKGNTGSSFIPGTLIFGTESLANEIVKDSGKTLLQIQKEINESGIPGSFELKEHTANIQLAKKSEPVYGKNVIGIVEGSDPVLKNECIVLSAHYDHVGLGLKGEVNNGADDNGTGTVALLEIAEAFMSMSDKPRRSIVFVWVTAEEKGLFGSEFYTLNPVIPLGNTVANINLDMVGRSADTEPEKDASLEKSLAGPNGVYIISGEQSSELIDISNEICKDLDLIPSGALTKAFIERSDYFHFYKNGIPILGLSTGLHEDYHKPTDELDKIDYNKMKRIAQYCFLVANEVANQKKRIEVDNPVVKK